MLDLSLQKSLYKVKWTDGTVITLKPPTQAIYKELIAVQNASEEEAMDYIYDMVDRILKNNLNKKDFDGSSLGIDGCMMLIQDYFAFYEKELDKIVFHQPL